MDKYKDEAIIFKAFCDERRLRIIDLIGGLGEICGCVLLEDLSITQPTLSHHMKILVDSGLVTSRKDGKRTMYKLSHDKIEEAKNILDNMLDDDRSNMNVYCKTKCE